MGMVVKTGWLLILVALTAACILILVTDVRQAPGRAVSAVVVGEAIKIDRVGKDPDLPTVVIVTTGGTIAEKTDPTTGGASHAAAGAELVRAVPGLEKVANIAVVNFSNIDSSQMSPQIWARLSRTVDELLGKGEFVGAVVTHGTDTMAEGAFFLDLTLTSDKPLVFTGAMNDASARDQEGRAGILNAVVQVCSPQGRNWGVTVTLNRYVNAARAVRKTQTTNVQTFQSGEAGYLGYVLGGKVYRLNEALHRQKLPLPSKLPRVVYIATYAGADGGLVRHAVDSGARGLVIDGVGAGNVNAATYEAIRYALSKKIPVVISSQVYHGAVEPICGDQGGRLTLHNEGCILAGDLIGPKARLLLMLGTAQHGPDVEALRKLFSIYN